MLCQSIAQFQFRIMYLIQWFLIHLRPCQQLIHFTIITTTHGLTNGNELAELLIKLR
jgi:hypothetical protein